METTDVNRDKLVADMRVVIADAEELLRATAGQAGEKVAAARARIQDNLETAKVKLSQLGEVSAERARAAARALSDGGRTLDGGGLAGRIGIGGSAVGDGVR